MFEKARALRAERGADNVFDFSLGNPDAPPPRAFFDALEAVARERNAALHRYMPNAGFDETRSAIAQFLSNEYRARFDSAGVIVTCGAAAAMNVFLRATCDPGDEVIVLAPYFPEYRFYAEHCGAVLKIVETDGRFQPDAGAIQQALTARTRAVILNSPNNPTGAVYESGAIDRVAAALSTRDSVDQPIYLICDDPYRRLLYDLDWCPTPVTRYARTVITSSFSKDLSLPGERLGYVAMPPALPGRDLLFTACVTLNRSMGFVNAPAVMQRVIARCAEARCDVELYREKRDALARVLTEAGYPVDRPRGGMFLFVQTPIADDARFSDFLIAQGIVVSPGRGFGRPGYMRLSFAVPAVSIERSAGGFAAARREALSTGGST